MKKKIIILSILIILFNILFSWTITRANWIDNLSKLWWSWTYKEKILSLLQITNSDWTINPNLIYKNIVDLRKMYRQWYLIWWSKKQLLIKAIVKNTMYCLTWTIWNLSVEWPVLSWSEYPLMTYTNSDWTTWQYFDFTTKALNKYIKPSYQKCFQKQFFDLFWFDKDKITYWVNYKIYDINWKWWMIVMWKFNIIEYNMIKWMLMNSNLTPYLIIVKTDKWIIWITLKSESNLKTFNEYLSQQDALSAKNNFTVNWKLQIDSFLINYCAAKFFWWDENKAINAIKNKDRNKCWLIPINIDGTWNDELLLKDDFDMYNIIYADQWTNTTLRVVKPIFKTNKDIFKFLKNADWTYSFLASNYVNTSTNSIFNLLMNNSSVISSWNCNSLMNTSIWFSCFWTTWDYIYKNIQSSNWLSIYWLNTYYTYSWNSDRWWILLKWDNWTWYIVFNDSYFWLSDNINWKQWDYIIFDRKKLWIKKVWSYLELNKTNNSLTIKVDWKQYLVLNSDWSYSTNFPNYVSTWWKLSTLFNVFNKIKSAWIYWSKVNWEKTMVSYFNFWKYTDWKYYLYWILSNWITNYIWLKQILSLWWDINFVSSNSSNVSNAIISWSVNYDDLTKYNWTNWYWILITNNKQIDWKEYYVWKDIYVYKNTFFTKNWLLFYNKSIFDFSYNPYEWIYNVFPAEDIWIKWLNLWYYSFLDSCSYEELINNKLRECTNHLLTWFDVDNDWYSEWIYKDNQWNIKIFNNVVKKNSDWTYSINFHEIFRSNWADYCTTDSQTIPYYNQNWNKCWPNVVTNWNCTAKTELIFKDWNWNYLYYKIDWTNPDDKQYILDKISSNVVNCDG